MLSVDLNLELFALADTPVGPKIMFSKHFCSFPGAHILCLGRVELSFDVERGRLHIASVD